MVEVALKWRPIKGEKVSGDLGEFWWLSDSLLLLMLCDGLGHGPKAHEAAVLCRTLVSRYKTLSLKDIIEKCNQPLGETRGVAMSLAQVDLRQQRVEMLGVGNIKCCMLHKERIKHYMPTPGIVGSGGQLKLETQLTSFSDGNFAIFLYSDGISKDLPTSAFRHHLLYSDLDLMLGDLVSEWGDFRDDVSVVGARCTQFRM